MFFLIFKFISIIIWKFFPSKNKYIETYFFFMNKHLIAKFLAS